MVKRILTIVRSQNTLRSHYFRIKNVLNHNTLLYTCVCVNTHRCPPSKPDIHLVTKVTSTSILIQQKTAITSQKALEVRTTM